MSRDISENVCVYFSQFHQSVFLVVVRIIVVAKDIVQRKLRLNHLLLEVCREKLSYLMCKTVPVVEFNVARDIKNLCLITDPKLEFM